MPKEAQVQTKKPRRVAAARATTTRKKTVRARSTKTVAKKENQDTADYDKPTHADTMTVPTRKAPTRIGGSGSASTGNWKFPVALIVAFISISGASVAIGMSDKGAIDVAGTIGQRASNQEAAGDYTGGAATRAIQTAAQAKNDTPNGGLVGRGNKETEQQKPAANKIPASVEASLATTTVVSSSTDSGVVVDDGTEDQGLEIKNEVVESVDEQVGVTEIESFGQQ